MNDDTFVTRLPSPPETAVIGVVVAVPEPWAQLLVDWRTKVGDPQARLVPPHVTLLPPTEVPAVDRAAVSEHLADVARAHPAFTMHLAGTGTFSPVSDVVFVTVAHDVAPDMLDLAYTGLADLSAEFRVEHFTEFEQTPTGAWAVAREYPLTGPPR